MNEEKIGIITLNGYRNYGNILQNLALQKALDKLNIASETIWYERGDHTTFVSKVSTHIRDRDLLKSLNYQFKIRFSRKYKTLEKSLMKRELNFKVFCQQNVTYSPFELNDNVLKDKKKINAVDRAYHSFLVGSDQVWGLSGESFPEVFFLPFTEKWKRNSFAASFGFSTIPQKKMIHRYKEALLAMNKISVREYEGADIVKSLTNRLPFVHLDPTFLLNRNDWDDIALQSTIHSHSKDYILTYFLGCKSQVWSDGINELALKDHLEIINLNDVNQQNFFLFPRPILLTCLDRLNMWLRTHFTEQRSLLFLNGVL